MKNTLEFLRRIREDPQFLKKAQACATDKEMRAFLREEGFESAPEEFAAAIRHWPSCKDLQSVQGTKECRKANRHDVFMRVTEVNNQPVRDTILLDISAWGAKIESIIPICADSTVELSFSLPGYEKEEKIQLSGKVVWSGQVPISKRYQVGLQFLESIEKLHGKGKFNLEKFRTTIQKRNEEISQKRFLTIKEFADTIGVHWFTVWRWTAENRIEFKQVKAGCKILIPTAELLKFQGTL